MDLWLGANFSATELIPRGIKFEKPTLYDTTSLVGAARQGQLKLLSPGFEPQDRDSRGDQVDLSVRTWRFSSRQCLVSPGDLSNMVISWVQKQR